MIPMLPRVPPNPVVMEFTIPNGFSMPSTLIISVARGIPPVIPTITVVTISAKKACTLVLSTRIISIAIPIRSAISVLCPSRPLIIIVLLKKIIYYCLKNGAYFAANLIASSMLTAPAMPLPAISNAVPWSTDVRRIGIPLVIEIVLSKSSVLVAICP